MASRDESWTLHGRIDGGGGGGGGGGLACRATLGWQANGAGISVNLGWESPTILSILVPLSCSKCSNSTWHEPRYRDEGGTQGGAPVLWRREGARAGGMEL